MFTEFFQELRTAKVPVTLREYLTLLEALRAGVGGMTVEGFYYLARAALVKDERNFDRFDRVFASHFRGATAFTDDAAAVIPDEWLRRMAELHLSEEEMRRIEALGGFDALMRELQRRLEEQRERHQGGSHWIGTAGTSPFGAYGYNPEGIRIGGSSRHRRAVKVWEKREFRDFADSVELGTRNIKVALRRLRRFVREGADLELDLPETIRATADNAGLLDLRMIPERRNKVKVLLALDVGGSMDDHVRDVERLFSAARSELKHLEHFYFHNCTYEFLWRQAHLRPSAGTPLWDVVHTYGRDYKLILVGDASMSPYEVATVGGAVDHWNAEAGHVWLGRLLDQYPNAVWLNPVPEQAWDYVESVSMIRTLMDDRMFPLTLAGLDDAMRCLSR